MMVLGLWILIALLTLIALGFVLLPLLSPVSPTKPMKSIIWLLAVLLPLAALGLYALFGTYLPLTNYWTMQREAKIAKQQLAQLKNPQQLIDQLTDHLRQHPDSAKGWYLLGRLYMGGQQYPQALHVFTKAHQLEPGNDEYTVGYAEAAFFVNGRRLTIEQQQLLQATVQRMPNNVAAINLLAVDAYASRHYQKAVQYWERLLPLFTAGSQDSKMVLQMIARAQRKL